jgi:hypothetical protein
MFRVLCLFTVALTVGCAAAPEAELTQSLTAEAAYGLSWVKSDDGTADGDVLRADLHIDAPVDVVWSLVRDPNGYQSFNRALTAHVDSTAIGAPIVLQIRLFGDALPPTESDEKIAIFDDALHVASWDRDFGFDQLTHRPQLVEAEGDGTHYYTALSIPKSFGWLVVATFGTHIKDAFQRFAAGLRDEAVRRAS